MNKIAELNFIIENLSKEKNSLEREKHEITKSLNNYKIEIQGKDRIIENMKISLERNNREFNDLVVKYNEIGTRS
jgi:predicted  nucleic acid-binding Zn-ribbon protein